jgi:histidyl-tRNA synthetase
MAKGTYVQPELAGGFRDYLPEDMIPRQKMLDTIKTVFERFGFVPLDTPGLEKEEVLTGGDPDFKKQIFRAGLEGGKDALALRFDLTVPLARVIAANPELKMPFKRYQFGRCWRGERQQAGRFREFMQLDADVVGSSSIAADAEVITLMYETMRALGFKDQDFVIKISDRRVLNTLADVAGFDPEKMPSVLRTLDKLDKIGWDGVEKEMTLAASLSKEQFKKVKAFIERGDAAAFAPLGTLLDIPKKSYAFDLSVARGLGYYTGVVFETVLTKLPSIGSIFSGGRYDGLVSRFSNRAIPAVGTSVGVDRLFVAMQKLGMIKKEKRTAQVCVLNFELTAERQCIGAATALRRAGIATNLYLGGEKTLKGQLAYAVIEEYPVVVIIGTDEAKRGVAQVKDMVKRTQTEVKQTDIVSAVQKLL